MKQSLALAMRPKTLDRLIGQEELVRAIRGHRKKKRLPQGWMFVGERGCGKTSVARILAVSLQCAHQKSFGNPCKKCYRHRKDFDITEINCSDVTGINELREAVGGSDYEPRPGSRVRVYILDEAQMLSKSAQNLLLKYFEDCPPTTYWIVATTDPNRILATLRRRCTGTYQLEPLKRPGVKKLVVRGLKFAGSKLDSEPLIDAVLENGVTSSGLVVNAVEKYVAGVKPEKAAQVEVVTNFDTHGLCRCIIKGLWGDATKQLKGATYEDTRTIRNGVAAYLKAILLDEDEISDRANVVADSIEKLTSLSTREESLQLSATVAVLYQLAKFFRKYQR